MKSRNPQNSFFALFTLVLLAFGLAGQTAKATLAVEEPFNYAAGDLAGKSILVSGATRTYLLVGTGTGPQVATGNLAYNGLNTPATQGAMASSVNSVANYNYLPLIGTVALTTEYFSFLIKITAIPTTTGQAVAGFGNAAGAWVAGTDTCSVYAKQITATTYSLGLQCKAATVQYETATHNLGDTVLVVVKYTSTGTVITLSMWVNPSTATFGGASDPAVATLTSSASSGNGWKAFAINSTANSGSGAFNFDTLRIASTYAEVTPTSSAPATPTAATFSSRTLTGFTAGWTASASGSPTGYRLDVSTASDFSTIITGYNDLDVGNVTSYAVTGLSGGTTYYFRVRAYNATGVSAGLASAAGGTLAIEPTTSASGVGFSSVAGSSMTVAWTSGSGANRIVLVKAGSAVDSNPVDGVTYTANPNFSIGTQIGSGNYVAYLGSGNSFTLAGLASGVTYYVSVFELNGSGGSENYLITTPATGNQATASCTPPAAPAKPTASAGCSSITVGWATVSGATSYSVYRSTSGGAYSKITFNQTGTSYVDSGLTAGVTYNYEVSAVGDCESALSPASEAVISLGLPTTAPAISGVTPDCTSLTVSWSSIGDATSYNVYRKLSGGSYSGTLVTGVTGTSYQDSTAVAGNSYVYAITAVNGCGENTTKSSDSTAAIINAPGIVTSPASVTVADALTATFTVVGSGGGTLSYQWQVSTDNGANFSDISGANTASYTTAALAPADHLKQYRCKVTSSTCSGTATSSAAILSVATHFRSAASGGLTWSSANTWQISVNGIDNWIATTGIPTLNDTAQIQNGHLIRTSSASSSVCGSLTIDTGGTLQCSASATSGRRRVSIAGNLVNNGTINDNGVTPQFNVCNLIEFTANATWSGSGNLSGGLIGVTNSTGTTLTLATSDGITLKSATTLPVVFISGTLDAAGKVITLNSGTFTLAVGATLISANPNGITGATATLNGGTLSLNAGANYTFNGSSGSQTTTGLPSAVNNLTIANTGSGVVLSSPTTVNGTLTLTSGVLTTTSGNLLTVAALPATIAGGSSTAYINGPLAISYVTPASKLFPIGVSPNYRPVTLSLTTVSGTPTITITPHEPRSFGGSEAAGFAPFTTRNWTVASSVTSGNACTLTVDGTDFSPSGSAILLGYNGTATTSYSPSFASPNYTVAGIALTSSSDFELGECALASALTAAPTLTGGSCGAVTVNWTGNGSASYNVYRKLNGGSYGAALATGLTGSTYSESSFTSGNTYVYAVTAVSTCGGESAKSSDSNPLTPTIAPSITSQPVSVTTGAGSTATFTVIANNATTYQWQVSTDNGASWANVATGTGGATASYTTVATTSAMNGYQFQCIVHNACSPDATSSAATLNVATYFKTLASGNYDANTTWQISVNGANGLGSGPWVNAPTGVIPNAAIAVEVQSGHTVNLASSTPAGRLTIDAGGIFVFGSTVSSTAARTLTLSGNLVNNGTIKLTTNNKVHSLVFAANASWTGSGDVSAVVSGATTPGLNITVNSGVILDASQLTTPIIMPSANTSAFTVNGTLNAGSLTITGNGSANTFTVAAGGSLVTANANGLINGTSGTLNFTVAPSFAGNLTFNGIANQNAVGLSGTIGSLTITNTGAANNNTVTLFSPVTISGLLQISSGTLTPFGTASTASTLSLESTGLLLESTGTWGSTSSTANHTTDAAFAGSGYVTVANGPKWFKSNGTGGGDWNDNSTWQISEDNGSTYAAAGETPTSAKGKVEILNGDTVTISTASPGLSIDEVTIDTTGQLTIGVGATVTLANGAGTDLTVNGTLLNQGTVTWTGATWALNAGATYIHYNLQGAGTTAYAAATINAASTWVYRGSSTVATPIASSGRVYGNLIIESADATAYVTAAASTGTLTVQGDFTLGANVTQNNSQTGAWNFNGNATINGTINTTSTSQTWNTVSGKTFTINGTANMGVAVMSGGANFTLASAGMLGIGDASGITSSGASGNIQVTGTRTFSTGGNYTYTGTVDQAAGNGLPSTVNNLTINATSGKTVTLNNGGMIINGSLVLTSGNISVPVTRAGATTTVFTLANAPTYANGLTVTTTSTFGKGEVIQLFSYSGTSSGSFSTVSLPSLATGLEWNAGGTTIQPISGGYTVNCDGSLTVGSPTYTRPGVSYKVKIATLLATANRSVTLQSVNSTTADFLPLTSDSINIYVPSNNLADSFIYTVVDAQGCTASGLVTLNINTNVFGQQSPNLTAVNGQVIITFAGIPDYSYTVQRATDVNAGPWINMLTTNVPASGLFKYIDENPPQPDAYYRLLYNTPGLDSAKFPGQNFDLSNFTIQLPINQSGVENYPTGDAYGTANVLSPVVYTNSANPDYCNGQLTNYFYTAADGAMTFWAPDTGSTTPNSTHARSELSNQTFFEVGGVHTMDAQCKVLQVTGSGKVCIGQIKTFSPNGQACMLLYNNGTIYANFWPTVGGSSIQYTFPLTVNLGDPISYRIQEANSVVSITVNSITHSVTLDSTYDHANIGSQFYFKAGCYSQNTDYTSSTSGSKVAFYSLTATTNVH